mmetsp:Transcript_13985/g.22915  ORF Transcript_13985/g.22915 Transcript_13985/m.22915 type:complete len:286 (-) Transcript_13985:1760-2617(-)
MALDARKEVGAREVAIVVMPLLTLLASAGLLFRSLPALESSRRDDLMKAVKPPHSLDDVNLLRQVLTDYSDGNAVVVAALISNIYILMLSFAIPGATTLSFVAGAVFGAYRATALIAFSITAGASLCYLVSLCFGRALATWIWPVKVRTFRKEVAKRRGNLLHYMLFLRLTPFVPNTFVNVVSPVVDIPFHVFALATCVGTLPQNFITAQMGLKLATVASFAELYDWRVIAFGVVAGAVILVPTFLGAEAGKSLKDMDVAKDDDDDDDDDEVEVVVGGKRGNKYE